MKRLNEEIGCSDTFVFDIPKVYQNNSGIYKITNDKTDYIYIGRTTNFIERYKKHRDMFTNNTNNCKIRYLRSCFDSIVFRMELVELTKDIVKKEEEYIHLYNSSSNGLNIIEKDSDILDLNCIKNNMRSDLIFLDASLKTKDNKLEQLNKLNYSSIKRKFNYIKGSNIKELDFYNPNLQRILSFNGLSTNGKHFYIKSDKFIKVTKKQFLRAIVKKKIIYFE